jgi:hypothetical protein
MPRRRKTRAKPSGAATVSPDMMGPTRERLAKALEDQIEIVTPDESEHWRAIRMLDGHVLEYLRSRECINQGQYSAGYRFYRDWYDAGLAASGVIDPGRVIVDNGNAGNAGEHRLAALTSWQRAVRAVGLIHSAISLALEALDHHYHPPRRDRTRASHAPGYRPTIIRPESDAEAPS